MKVVSKGKTAALPHAGQFERKNAAHAIRPTGDVAAGIQPLIPGKYVVLGNRLLFLGQSAA